MAVGWVDPIMLKIIDGHQCSCSQQSPVLFAASKLLRACLLTLASSSMTAKDAGKCCGLKSAIAVSSALMVIYRVRPYKRLARLGGSLIAVRGGIAGEGF